MKTLLAFLKGTTLVEKGIIFFLSSILTVLVSMKAALLGLGILIFIDLITGIRANLHNWGISFNLLKKNFWKSIKSYLLRKTWKKSYEYGLGIIVISILETLIFGEPVHIMFVEKTFTLVELSTIIPALVETWSIFENFESVSGNNILKRISFLLPTKLRSLLTVNKQEETDKYE